MSEFEPVTFESPVQKQLYKQVERSGPQALEDLVSAVEVDTDSAEDALGTLEEKGYVEQSGSEVRLRLDLGEEQRHETRDFTYVVRPARESDFDAVLDVVEAIAEKKTYVIAERLAAELAYDETVLRHNSIQSRVFFIATTDDTVIGWSHLDLPLTQKLRPTAELTVGVRESYRGYGIGTELLERALSWAHDNDYLKVYKNVARTNMQAVSFLESRGWEQEGIRDDHYRIGHKQVDQIMMAHTF
jgi:GNAT superfamily N-acetyltransferase